MSKLDISFHVHSDRWKSFLRPYTITVRHILEVCVTECKLKGNIEVAIVLADDAFIKSLNNDYRGKDKATNVLSFPSELPELGDIVLAIETIEKEAKEQGKSFRHHAAHLLVHGFLHLLGYDHIIDKDALKMEQLEIKILKKLGVTNPYL